MSSRIRSLEDAAEQIIDTLKHFLQVNTLFITADNGYANRVIQAFNRHEVVINNCTRLPLLQSYSSLAAEQPGTLLVIPNTLEYERTADLPITKQLGACSFVGIALRTADDQSYGTICALNREPIRLKERQIAFLESMAHFLVYIIELENSSVTDSLTGLFNRRYLSHLYTGGSDKRYSVMFIDIDDFKEVNDTFGHDFGDHLLLEIAARLRQSVRKTDIIVRYGGDEFIICFQHLVENQDTAFVVDKIKNAIKQPFIIDGKEIHISASLGISASHGWGTSLKELISDADHAMYEIKQNEKNP
ncbi:sensor domain-containing diguanylate cyclase [Paenibacillus alkaliterrae]|uniref:sensor domain-containing diguanylate cyclase n=1 Tax=Paenibacillus alkaliterrae TaxID=320909 RepID=UPI001F3A2D61|nr:sensor domain-containing diguanylate cyclase [Paenibacillus alkaliterrae]MCF2941198.1 sensor domain-containing diguanylate cyclase [Paenibacillus alkaliterrae]